MVSTAVRNSESICQPSSVPNRAATLTSDQHVVQQAQNGGHAIAEGVRHIAKGDEPQIQQDTQRRNDNDLNGAADHFAADRRADRTKLQFGHVAKRSRRLASTSFFVASSMALDVICKPFTPSVCTWLSGKPASREDGFSVGRLRHRCKLHLQAAIRR